MFINQKQALAVMKEYGLSSFDELFLIQCLYTRDMHTLVDFFTNHKDELFTNDGIRRLAKFEVLQESHLPPKGQPIEFADLYLTKSFIDKFFTSEEAGKELWLIYPNTAYINGQDVILKKGEKIGTEYYDKDKLISIYHKKIAGNKELHDKIIEKVKKNKAMINFTLRSFILDELWDSLPEESSNNEHSNRIVV